MGETLDRMIAELRLREYSIHTQRSYLSGIRRYWAHFDEDPDVLGREHVREYLLHLLDSGKSGSTRRVNRAAIRFYYVEVLDRPDVMRGIAPPRAPYTLPEILSRGEVVRVLKHLGSPRCRMVAMVIYGTGLRVSEACALQVQDLDSERMLIRVRQGKGKRDRYVMFPEVLLRHLRAYWLVQRPLGTYLFGALRDPNSPMAVETVRAALRHASEAAGIRKPVSPHILRHCFATHMLEMGVDIAKLQIILGHRCIHTTMRYTQMSKRSISATKSPLDSPIEEGDDFE